MSVCSFTIATKYNNDVAIKCNMIGTLIKLDFFFGYSAVS